MVAQDVPLCSHHWRIDPPRGAESHALCLKCGEERMFSNSEATRSSFSRRPAKGAGAHS
jgi:hypothetical protein